MQESGLNILSSGYSTDYDDKFDPRITNEFATAAFRFGHSMIPDKFMLMSSNGDTIKQLSLKETFFKPEFDNESLSSNMDGFMHGMAKEEASAWDENFVASIRDHLFELNEADGGMDLVALNIQRGRDHGIPGYIKYLENCTNTRIQQWDDLINFMESDNIDKLQDMYQNLEDIDIFVGGFMETNEFGSLLGPVFKCIIEDQFTRLKKGDRFFYDLSPDLPNVNAFTLEQLQEIRKVSMSRLICENTDVGKFQTFAFKLAIPFLNEKIPCKDILDNPGPVNWNVFKDESKTTTTTITTSTTSSTTTTTTDSGSTEYCNSIACGDPSNLSEEDIRRCYSLGSYVVAGPSWTWNNTNGEPGEVTETLNNDGRLKVKWQNGMETYYCMGCKGSEELFYVQLDCGGEASR